MVDGSFWSSYSETSLWVFKLTIRGLRQPWEDVEEDDGQAEGKGINYHSLH